MCVGRQDNKGLEEGNRLDLRPLLVPRPRLATVAAVGKTAASMRGVSASFARALASWPWREFGESRIRTEARGASEFGAE